MLIGSLIAGYQKNGQNQCSRCFCGRLLTITNEFAEICSINLVLPKARSQYAVALEGISKSVNIFGHSQPVVFYTDNVRGDAAFLRKAYPSLNVNIHPTPSTSKWSHLKTLNLPHDTETIICKTKEQVDNSLRLITDSIEGNGEEVAGFDTEWNIELMRNAGGVIVGSTWSEGTASVQITLQKSVYIIQACSFKSSCSFL